MPPDCTTSRALPVADFMIGAILGGLVAGTTNKFIEEANEQNRECPSCQHGKGPAILAAFLVISPWWISSAVGFSETGRCRDAYRARGFSP